MPVALLIVIQLALRERRQYEPSWHLAGSWRGRLSCDRRSPCGPRSRSATRPSGRHDRLPQRPLTARPGERRAATSPRGSPRPLAAAVRWRKTLEGSLASSWGRACRPRTSSPDAVVKAFTTESTTAAPGGRVAPSPPPLRRACRTTRDRSTMSLSAALGRDHERFVVVISEQGRLRLRVPAVQPTADITSAKIDGRRAHRHDGCLRGFSSARTRG